MYKAIYFVLHSVKLPSLVLKHHCINTGLGSNPASVTCLPDCGPGRSFPDCLPVLCQSHLIVTTSRSSCKGYLGSRTCDTSVSICHIRCRLFKRRNYFQYYCIYHACYMNTIWLEFCSILRILLAESKSV